MAYTALGIMFPFGIACISIIFTITIFGIRRWWAVQCYEYDRLNPPGPRPLPFLGNIHQVPMDYQYKAFTEWSKVFGDLIFLRLFRKAALIINSTQAAQDLLEKRGAKYSDRPYFILFSELIQFEPNVTIMPYGDQWRLHRKWIQASFQDRAALQSYEPIQARETNRLLRALIESPGDFTAHLKRYVATLMMEITYGHTVTNLDDDEFIRLADRAVSGTVEAGSPAAALVDFFPLLKHIPTWMPGAGFKRKAFEVREYVRQLQNVPFAKVRNAMAAGIAKPSLLRTLIQDSNVDGFLSPDDEYNIKGAGSVIYGAGTDTTVTVLISFVLAMVLHPDVCQKAQAELDRVLGNGRLPELIDRDSLPYIDCVLKEVYRWNPPVPLCLPHKLTQDDEYRGFHIPGQTMIIPNIWGMTRDVETYPEPETFYPERFEEMDKLNADANDPRNLVFGFGRRLCPGRQFGDTSIWLAVANMLAIFEFRKAVNSANEEAELIPSFVSGTISHPRPFSCNICLRPGRTADLIPVMDYD
uniref:Cytochrome P450 n=1 Tax=Wolfiporia cocos TaxID=81056 RepID=A0A7T0M812_9APHY|nr:cytochrome P450 [Wolfiporia cocos]